MTRSLTRSLTRRQLLERAALGGAALTLPGLLAACGSDDDEAAGTTAATAQKELADRLRFANWQLYVDVDEKTKKRPTLDQFKTETGVSVDYFEEINSNDEYFGKIQGPLSRGQSIDRDIIVLTDNSRYPGLMVEEGWLEELDKDAIPNIANLVDALQSPPFDPDRTYSLPWQSGMTGIAYNEKLTSTPITSIDQLLEDSKLKGKITLLSEMADTLGVVMKANGDDPAEVTDDTFKKAIDRVKAAVDSGQVRQFTGNDYTGPLSKGDLVAALSWSGDVVQLQADNASLKWGIPEGGGMIWTDNMLIPKGGDAFTASTYMNFVYDPKVAAQIAAYVNYVTPVKGAKEELAKTDPDTASNPLIFPDDATLAKVSGFDSKALNNQDYIEQWQTLLGA
jgi:spermidine/putrescine transport system substrate-binding protein